MKLWEPLFWYQIDPLFYAVSFDFLKLLHLLILSILLLFIGSFGLFFFYQRLTFIHVLLLLELLLLGLSLLVIVVSYYYTNPIGLLLVFFFLTLAAAESSIGLSFLILFYRVRNESLLQSFNKLFG